MPGCADGPKGVGALGGWVYLKSYANGTGASQNATSVFDVTQGSIYPYVTNKAVYVCPDDNQGQVNGLSYALNQCVDEPSHSTVPVTPGENSAKFDDPADIMLLGEEAAGVGVTVAGLGNTPNSVTGTTDDGYLDFWYYNNTNKELAGSTFPNYLSTRHSMGSDVLFVDGHVKWQNQSNLYKPDPQPSSTWSYPYYSIMTGDSSTDSCN